jgi:eukaryotic-like serine/threonine-protein kinase
MIGSSISHYEILEKLGEGGMGVVYKAHDTQLDRPVALKFLHPTGGPSAKERLIREAQAVAQLDHPNICTVYEIGEADGMAYIAMAYIEGETLKERIEKNPPELNEVVDYARQIAAGLQSAHQKNIIHRDIKTSNIIVTPDGQIKIMDFGLAKFTDRTQLTQEGSISGTVVYMSPEQARGENLDQRTDIWSFGVVLYEMLSGRPPFQADYETAVVYSILNEDPPPVSQLNPNTPEKLAAIVEKSLKKKKEDRYDRVDGLIADLEALSGTTRTATIRLWSLVRRKSWVYATATLFFIVAGGILVYFLLSPVPDVWSVESIAVLPLENLSGDSDQEYLVDGLHDALITDLAKMGGLRRVIARPSVMRYRGTEKSVRQIARELNVDAVLTGAVARIGDRVRVTAQLINPVTEDYFWAERYEREIRDVLRIQSDIVTTIARQLEIKLTPEKVQELERVGPVNPETYEAYLRGMHFLHKGTEDDTKRGLAYLREAVDKDPGDARAYAGLALGYTTAAHGPEPPDDALSFARASAEKAIQLDRNLDIGYVVLGFIKGYIDWDWDAAFGLIDQALEINPHLAIAHYHKSWFDVLFGRMEEAIVSHKRAQELDPLLPLHTAWLGEIYRMQGRYDEAIAECQKAIEIDPDTPTGHAILGHVFADQGRFEEAFAAYRDAAEVAPAWRFAIGIAYAKAGQLGEVQRVLSELEQLEVTPWRAWWRAALHTALGNKDEAFRWLGYEPPHSWVPWMRVMTEFEPLRDDPRFEERLRRMNLPLRVD